MSSRKLKMPFSGEDALGRRAGPWPRHPPLKKREARFPEPLAALSLRQKKGSADYVVAGV